MHIYRYDFALSGARLQNSVRIILSDFIYNYFRKLARRDQLPSCANGVSGMEAGHRLGQSSILCGMMRGCPSFLLKALSTAEK